MRFEFWFKEDDIAYSEFFDKFPVDDGLIVIDHEDSKKCGIMLWTWEFFLSVILRQPQVHPWSENHLCLKSYEQDQTKQMMG